MYFITYDLIPHGQTRDLQWIDISWVKSTTIIRYKTTRWSEIVGDYHGVMQAARWTAEKFTPKEQKSPNAQYHTNQFDGEIGMPLPDSKFRDGKSIPRDK
ncbi:MAG: hypothetical protein ACD_80C00022G0002 [uncultured bacterium (gcode 4)]|uniref:Uncharacterized protein n=1 Tax=uncultured bacterium (gcode 4) TaxID=1234023 RepID=K1XK09_9BACT|nr:MAG: hypothetical protein ACD_80C00022G0002 [uncultured bacterium (gcode 4)]